MGIAKRTGGVAVEGKDQVQEIYDLPTDYECKGRKDICVKM